MLMPILANWFSPMENSMKLGQSFSSNSIVEKECRRHDEKLLLTYDHPSCLAPHSLITNAASSSDPPTTAASLFRSWKLFICSRYQLEPCGSSARYQGSHEWRRVRQDRWRGRAFQGRIGIRDVFNPTWEGRKRSARARLRHKDSRDWSKSKAIQWSYLAARSTFLGRFYFRHPP